MNFKFDVISFSLGLSPGWFVDFVLITNETTGLQYRYSFFDLSCNLYDVPVVPVKLCTNLKTYKEFVSNHAKTTFW